MVAKSGTSMEALPPAPDNHGDAWVGSLGPLESIRFKPGKKREYEAERGMLTVPENWDEPTSRLIELPVVRIPATGPDPAEPVFWLQGGPGAPNLSFSPPDWLLARHDVIEVGYRGVEGTVKLQCPGVNAVLKSYLSKDLFGEEARAELVAAAKQCAQDHRAAGVDLAGYTVPGVIKDMEAARVALGYERINLYSGSYGTRVAQMYSYLYPDSLHRVVMIGLNTPGHFVYDPPVLDVMIEHMSDLCAQDPECSRRTDDLARTIYDVNRTMPRRRLFLPIDPGSIRLGTHMMFFSTVTMPMVLDMYLAAGRGDASGLAMLNLAGKYVFPPMVLGDFINKGGTLDLESYRGLESISLGESMMGAPLAELIWPMAAKWPLELVGADLRRLQESDVDMLIVNGSLDFSTPPTALEEARPYWHKAQFLTLAEFSHVNDVEKLQPEAFERLITSYYDTGIADDSLFVYQPLTFKPKMSLPRMAKLLLAAMVVVMLLVIGGSVLLVRYLV